ncbi:MAG TPA: isochorismatase family protein [Thermoleophilaceae bacterium]|nr:isochorismatase family protein [Thermoleophilaceae bacterium]
MLERDRTTVLVVDVQEAFRKGVEHFDDVAKGSAVLLQAAQIMGLPVVVTEQYPKGLGATVDEVARHLGDVVPLPKTVFSGASADGFDLGGRDQVLMCGIEAHVCVHQTAAELLAGGVEVHVAVDAVGSRSALDREVGLRRMTDAGAVPTTVETALFEMFGKAGGDEFKQVQGLVK